MEENKDNHRVCGHCNKEVAQFNFVLHESHCQRFLNLCPDCKEPLAREDLEQHRSDEHTLVWCTQCDKKMEHCHLQDHQEEECEKRMQCCQFCQLQLPFQSLANHIATCSCRTRRCSDCGRYIMLRDLDGHAVQCSTMPQEGAPLKEASKIAAAHTQTRKKSFLQLCTNCMKSVASDQMQKHQLACIASSPPSEKQDVCHFLDPDYSHFMSLSPKRNKTPQEKVLKDMEEISTCPYCHLALPLATLHWHESKCRLFEHLRKSVAN